MGERSVYYGETVPEGGTEIAGMRNSYATLYLRSTFVVGDPAILSGVSLRALIDDGFIAWINGVEVVRHNAPDGEAPFDAAALATGEPAWFDFPIPDAELILQPGENRIAVQVFNSTISSSGLVLAAELTAEARNDVAPVVETVIPAAGEVAALRGRVPHLQADLRHTPEPERSQPDRAHASDASAFDHLGDPDLHGRDAGGEVEGPREALSTGSCTHGYTKT